MDIGKQIKALRLAKEVKQEELAEYLGVSFQAVSKWETGGSHSIRYVIKYDNTTLI